MSNKILYSPKEGTTGFWGLRDVPTQPIEDDYKRHRAPGLNDFIRAESDYIKTLESCKSNKLEIVSKIEHVATKRDASGTIIVNIEGHAIECKPGDIFDLPIGYEFKDERYYPKENGNQSIHDLRTSKAVRVLRLVKTETTEKQMVIEMGKRNIGKILAKELAQPEPEEKIQTKEESGYCAYPDDCQWPLGCHKSCNPQSEESQECLLRQIFNITGVDDLYTIHYKKILSQFTIQRKKQ